MSSHHLRETSCPSIGVRICELKHSDNAHEKIEAIEEIGAFETFEEIGKVLYYVIGIGLKFAVFALFAGMIFAS